MATRKKAPEPAQSSLFAFPKLTAPPVAEPEIKIEIVEAPRPELESETEPEPEIDPVVVERKLRLVPPPDAVPAEEVSIEPLDDGRFVVAVVRHYGGSVAAVIYTRTQLEMLQRRIPSALEIG